MPLSLAKSNQALMGIQRANIPLQIYFAHANTDCSFYAQPDDVIHQLKALRDK